MSKKKYNKKSVNLQDKSIFSNRVEIFLSNNIYTFEVSDIVTDDILEGIVLCMIYENDNSPVWDLSIDKSHINEINPIKSLFWLTGGVNDWEKSTYYNVKWVDAYIHFNDEYSILLIEILLSADTFKEVKDMLIEYVNLIDLYEFALSKNMIKL